MTRAEILIEIEGEIARLVEVRRILVESAKALKKIHSTTRKTVAAATKKTRAQVSDRKSAGRKRTLSPEGRRRIALGQKKRWARLRAAQTK
jgi:nicotinate-nucleotide pyrophosphorylase